MNVAILVYNSFRNDARVEKAKCAYSEAGHEVRVVALEDALAEARDDQTVLRIALRQNLLFRRRESWTWAVERYVLSRLRFAAAFFSAAGLWLTWRGLRFSAPSMKGSALSLLRFADRIRGYRLYALRVPRALRHAGFRPDLVHANDFNTLLAAERLLDHWGVPFIYDSHELWSGRNRADIEVHPLESEWELANERRIAKKAAAVVTVSKSIARHMADLLGVPEPTVVRNLPYTSKVDGSSGLRQLLRMAPEVKLLVYTGKATFNRGLEDVVDALARLPASVHLLVLGNFEPRFKVALDAKLTEHRLEGRFHHYGPVPSEEVSTWASSGDLCLVPIKGVCLSYEYCLPNKLFEGIQAGLPVLASNLVEMRNTLDQYGCGLTYQSGNVEDLCAKISHILGTPGVAEQLRGNAVEAARELNWENEKRRLLEVLSERVSPART